MKSAQRSRLQGAFLALSFASLISGCGKPLLTCPRAVKVPEPPAPQQHPAMVLFATDRLPEAEQLSFSSELNPSPIPLSYGAKCEDPAGSKAGCAEPSFGLTRDDFLGRIGTAQSDVVLFVHGFKYSFDESLEISLRIVERAQVRAVPVAYSWPSQNKGLAYVTDYDMSEWTIEHLAEFIQDLVRALPANARLHIIAHSMGNRALLWALARLHLPQERLGQLIMIAPDVDPQIFKQLVERCGAFTRKTVYVSNHDLALGAAGFLHSGRFRAGDAKKQYLVVKDVDTVDASPLKAGFVGHSIYDYSQLMFEDLGGVLQGKTVADRNLPACTVKSISSYNAAHGTQLPCVVYRLPSH